MARTARNARPGLSDAPADKLAAALNYPIGKWKRRNDRDYGTAPFYLTRRTLPMRPTSASGAARSRHRGIGGTLLQGLHDQQGLREQLHQPFEDLSQAEGMRVRCAVIDWRDEGNELRR